MPSGSFFLCRLRVFVAFKGNIYWTDHGLNLIEVARLNGMYRAVVISEGLDQPRAITVHPAKGCVSAFPCFLPVLHHGFSFSLMISGTQVWRSL